MIKKALHSAQKFSSKPPRKPTANCRTQFHSHFHNHPALLKINNTRLAAEKTNPTPLSVRSPAIQQFSSSLQKSHFHKLAAHIPASPTRNIIISRLSFQTPLLKNSFPQKKSPFFSLKSAFELHQTNKMHLSTRKSTRLFFPVFFLLMAGLGQCKDSGEHDPFATEGSFRKIYSGFSKSQDSGEQYRKNYPGLVDSPNLNENIRFYSGALASTPDGDFIENIHQKWWGQYQLLEYHHSYIQWLFPIREGNGVNPYAFPLQKHEAKTIQNDPQLFQRAIKSYELMLDFYGMKLSPETGALSRTENFQDRYNNLNYSAHNYLRITRILKFLGEIGLEHYKLPFLEFVINEMYENGQLTRAWRSLRDFWVPVLRNDQDRNRLLDFLNERGPPSK